MLNSENVQEDGVYLLENGEDGLIYVGNMVNPATLEQIFGVSSLAALPVQASLFTIYYLEAVGFIIPCVARI
jgi:protein transport protein SEC24